MTSTKRPRREKRTPRAVTRAVLPATAERDEVEPVDLRPKLTEVVVPDATGELLRGDGSGCVGSGYHGRRISVRTVDVVALTDEEAIK